MMTDRPSEVDQKSLRRAIFLSLHPSRLGRVSGVRGDELDIIVAAVVAHGWTPPPDDHDDHDDDPTHAPT
jgi:hypothetical protein